MLLDPKIRVYNAAHKCSLDLASIMSSENVEQHLPDGAGFYFNFPVVDPAHPLVESPFPDTDVIGEIRWRWYRESAIIQISARHASSDKLHSMFLSPPNASKEEIIVWLRNKDTWSLMEEKWWVLYKNAKDD